MSETANPSADPARLDELAEVTREYARYSRTAYGLGYVAMGAIVVGVVGMNVVSHTTAARITGTFLAPAWLVVVAAARAFYQREGAVVEPAQAVEDRGGLLFSVYGLSALQAIHITHVYGERRLGFWAMSLAILGVVAIPALAAEVVRGKRDVATTFNLVIAGFGLSRIPLSQPRCTPGTNDCWAWILDALIVVPAFVGAVTAIPAGVRQHARHRALQRRLAALRSGA